MECPSCHTHNRPEAKFCQVCGTTLSANPQAQKPSVKNKLTHQTDLPVTAPLSTRVDSFNPLPVGALLDRGRYVVWETRSTDENINIYLVEDIVPVRQCTNCGNFEKSSSARSCVICGTDLNTAHTVTLRYIAEERLHNQNMDIELQFVEMIDQHPGLYLPHAIFTEKPYSQERHYRVTPELLPLKASALKESQELTTVLRWGIMLAEALDILHSAFVTPNRITLDDIVIDNNRIAWTSIDQAQTISQAERVSARKTFQSDVHNLSGILWYLATGQTKIKEILYEKDSGSNYYGFLVK